MTTYACRNIPIDAEREKELCRVIQGKIIGDKERSLAELLSLTRPLVFKVAWKYAQDPHEFDRLSSLGFQILSGAAKRYDQSRNVKFSTFAYHILDSELKHHHHHNEESIPGVRIPIKNLWRYRKIVSRMKDDEKKSKVTSKEASFAGHIKKILETLSLDHLLEINSPLLDSVTTYNGIYEFIKKHDTQIILNMIRSNESLTKIELEVLEMYYLEGLTRKEISERLNLKVKRLHKIDEIRNEALLKLSRSEKLRAELSDKI